MEKDKEVIAAKFDLIEAEDEFEALKKRLEIEKANYPTPPPFKQR